MHGRTSGFQRYSMSVAKRRKYGWRFQADNRSPGGGVKILAQGAAVLGKPWDTSPFIQEAPEGRRATCMALRRPLRGLE